jgi:DNA-binding SARP family transcriptional activator
MSERFVRTIGTLTIDGTTVTQRQGSLMAALALYRTTGATMDALVDAVWGERAPASARKSVQNQVARLRSTFGSDLVVTDRARYHLAALTDVAVIDATAARFDPANASAGDIAAVADVLRDWRGVPFADLEDNHHAGAERARLDLVQSRLVESLALARLGGRGGTGACSDAIIDLTVRTSTHPLHERAWELLVIGLHLDGRRTEALGTYERFAHELDSQLGVAPSSGFQHLRRMVDADEPVDATVVFPTAAPRSIRRLLASA